MKEPQIFRLNHSFLVIWRLVAARSIASQHEAGSLIPLLIVGSVCIVHGIYYLVHEVVNGCAHS